MSISTLPAEDFDERSLPLDNTGGVDLEAKADKLGIKYFLVSYTPLNSDTRVSVIPKRVIGNVQRDGCGIPSAMFFDATGADPEMYLLPDPATLIQLPWKPEYGWVASNLYMHGKPFNQCPRRTLIKQMHRAKKMGYVMKSGIEPEFIILDKNGKTFGDQLDSQQSMCLQEPLATMRMAPVMMKIYDTMETLGWDPYEVDHEATCCQYEINFGFFDALTLADRHAFLKFMVKELAELEGYRATFMPVPLNNLLCASGLHVHVSLWDVTTGANAFSDASDKDLGLSRVAYHFLGGVKKHAEASCAVMCPTVNSYKRLNAGSWCPNTVSWGGNNRTVLIRVPANNRIEHRLADGSCNPHLLQAILLAAGLDGIENKLDPGEKTDFEVQKHPEKFTRKMPNNLLDSLRVFDGSKYFRKVLGSPLVDGFIKLKQKEWDEYMSHLTDWEKHYYLNC